MGWEARVVRWREDEAEIRVDVRYFDGDGARRGQEQIVEPAGTPEARIFEEAGRRGRSLRAEQSRGRVDENSNVGKVFPIDDL